MLTASTDSEIKYNEQIVQSTRLIQIKYFKLVNRSIPYFAGKKYQNSGSHQLCVAVIVTEINFKIYTSKHLLLVLHTHTNT